MPQITIEYTENLRGNFSGLNLFSELHQCIHQTTGIQIENCKSRATRLDDYFIGEGGNNKAFVHVAMDILEGRPSSVIVDLGQNVLEMLKKKLVSENEKLELQITVQIGEMKRKNYFKYPEGTLTI
ncbi:MAG: hypothetical protein R2750_10710 [Bacteroidales bacterium]